MQSGQRKELEDGRRARARTCPSLARLLPSDKTKMGHRVTACPTIPPPPTQILHFSLLAPLVHGAGKLWCVFTELLDSLLNWFLLLAHKTLMYYRTFSCLIPEWLRGSGNPQAYGRCLKHPS